MSALKMIPCCLAIVIAAGSIARAQTAPLPELPNAKPVSLMQVIPKPYGRASFTRDGKQIAAYHFGAKLHRPFLYPIIGPSGRSLTRMGHPGDPTGHSHHTSVWISHHDVNGVNFWSDRGKGRITHQRILKYEDDDTHSAIVSESLWKTTAGKSLLLERRRLEIRPLDGGEWMLIVDLQLKPVGQPVTLGKTPFGMIGVRMAKTIGVADGGGTIRNSVGAVDERGVFWKRAKWVDYSGPITQNTAEGITLMDHPSNPNHPTNFHVRNDGWMGASLTHTEAITITAERPLVLKYALYVHSGVPSRKAIGKQYDSFARSRAINLLSNPQR